MKKFIAFLMLTISAGAMAAPTSQPAESDTRFPSFGISVTPPAGWIRMSEHAQSTVVKWIELDEAQTKTMGIIQVEVQTNPAPTLDAFAAAVAKANHGAISAEKTTIGDSHAIEFVADAGPQKGDVHLAAVRMTEHGGYIYGVYLMGPTGVSRSEFDGVCQSIKWTDYASPADSLARRNVVPPILFALFDTGFSFALPDPFRFSKTEKGKDTYVTFDFAKKTFGATLEISRAPGNGAKPPDLQPKVARDAGCATVPEWTKLESNGNVFYTAPTARGNDKDGAAQGPVQLIL